MIDHANILELLGAFFLGCVITVGFVWTVTRDADEFDDDDDLSGFGPDKEQLA